ncbi:MAG: hypothetical protein LC797_23175 [Chloroflexi bacterium]|nr:hypothetical protein [Chloroflexota bacterium]
MWRHRRVCFARARHAPRIVGLARRLLDSKEDAEDAAQDSFVRTDRARGSFRGHSARGCTGSP